MNRKIKTKEEASKISQKAHTPSESTKIFKKIIRINEKIPLSVLSPTKYSMSSKDWSEMSKRVDSLMQGKEDVRSKKIPSKFKF